MKKSVSAGLATQTMEQQSRVAESLPLSVKRSPTWSACRKGAGAGETPGREEGCHSTRHSTANMPLPGSTRVVVRAETEPSTNTNPALSTENRTLSSCAAGRPTSGGVNPR